jgi:hypothetical protein
MRASRKLVFLTAATAALLAMPAILTAQTEVRYEMWPGSARWPASAYQAPPSYAQISWVEGVREIYHDSEWAAIPFYRDPKCVPPDFNLLDYFDVPRVFDCAPMVQGFEIIRNQEPQPIKGVYWGLGDVTIYFVRWQKMQQAMADQRLTIDELKTLVKTGDAMEGTAQYFWCELHPTPAVVPPFIEISANGAIENRGFFSPAGRQPARFQFYVTGGDQEALIQYIRIAFEYR